MNAIRNRLAVIGAGPIGLEAALHAADAAFDVEVYERGRVAENIRDIEHIRFFSPFGMNSSELGRRTVQSLTSLPSTSALLTGFGYWENYLVPLSRSNPLQGRIHEHTEVVSIGRTRLTKSDAIAKPDRANEPFRLLVCDRQTNRERYVEADIIFDCSGVYGNPNNIGPGGLTCLGERESLSADDYKLPDVLGKDRKRFASKRTVVVGSGYSAATAIVSLAKLAETEPNTSAIWLTRTDRTPPITLIPSDRLAERNRLGDQANLAATRQDGKITWRHSRQIESIRRNPENGRYELQVINVEKPREPKREKIEADCVIANVGYRPNRDMYEELQFHECYATQGPIMLAAALLGDESSDCLNQQSRGIESLANPEPNFFVLGAKSYGRDSRFLISVGLQQIQDVLDYLDAMRSAASPVQPTPEPKEDDGIQSLISQLDDVMPD